MNQSLFRPESILNDLRKLDGEVLITKPRSLSAVVALLLFALLVGLIYAYHLEFTRKQTVRGYLQHQSGEAKLYSPSHGTITKLEVKLGQSVAKGDPIARVSSDTKDLQGHLTAEQVIHALEERKKRALARRSKLLQEREQARTRVTATIESLQSEVDRLEAIEKVRIKRQRNSELKRQSITVLRQEGVLPEMKYLEYMDTHLHVVERVKSIRHQISRTRGSIPKQQALLHLQDSQYQSQLLELQDQVSAMDRNLADARRRQGVTLAAPISGIVASLPSQVGDVLGGSIVVATIVPPDSPLVAKLLIPSSAAGFLHEGRPVTLMYDAYPYQRFGVQSGTISMLSSSTILPGELPEPIEHGEPSYVASVMLPSEGFYARGEERALRPGMLLSADLQMESQTLLAWLMDPILSLRGRI